MHLHHPKATRLFLVLGGFFIANALLAEFIGAKIFSLERSMGFQPLNIRLFGIDNLRFDMTSGVLLWPFVFILTDIINEYFGRKGVRLLSILTAGLIVYGFVMVYLAIELVPADFWVQGEDINRQLAFATVFRQGLWIIAGSLVAFLLGQLVDVTVFQWLRRRTGERYIWLRAQGSTLVSQCIDSFVVLYIAFGLGADWTFQQVMAIGIVNYIYKFSAALVLTPLLYLVHDLIDRYLGHELAHAMTEAAADHPQP